MEIPGYQIIRQIGKGGMATVYLAVQESLDRQVAIKLMSPFLTEDQTFGERFLREAKIVAKLSHPNIIAVYDVGTIEDQYYIAMQYSPGGDLKAKITQGLTEPQAVFITQQIASALQYAHDNGFVHRDVKPANVLFNEHGNACLTDFGVAKATHSATTTLTVAGSVIGTPVYMSPEQARGDDVDNRSDLYSLGVVFFEMLSGQPPFKGDSGVSIAIKHISEPVPKLDSQCAHYQDFINKLLSKNREERFQNGNEIIQELNNIYQHSSGVQTQIMANAVAPALNTGPQSVVTTDATGQPAQLADSMKISQPVSQPRAQATLPPNEQPPRHEPIPTHSKPGPSKPTPLKPTPLKKVPLAITASLLLIVVFLGGLIYFEVDVKKFITSSKPQVTPSSPAAKPNTPPPVSVAVQTEPLKQEMKQESKPSLQKQPPHLSPQPSQRQRQPLQQQETQQTSQPSPQQAKLEKLLQLAETAFDNKRFVYPEKENALDAYREALEIDPQNAVAKQGIRKISDWYVHQSREAINAQQWDLAEQHLSRAKMVEPSHPQLASLITDFNQAHREETIKKQNMQKQVATNQPRAENKVQPKPKTSPTVSTPSTDNSVKHVVTDDSKSSKTVIASTVAKSSSATSGSVTTKPATTKKPVKTESSSRTATEDKPKRQSDKPSGTPARTAAQPEAVAKLDSANSKPPAEEMDQRQRMETLERQIKELNDKATALLAKKDLSIEELEQAHNYYKDIDKLSPHHAKAKAGYTLLVTTCVNLATAKMKRRDYNDARVIVEKGLALDRKNRKLIRLQRRLRKAPQTNLSDTKKSNEAAKERREPERRSFGTF
jgi:serine/threonine protein kinase